MIIIWYNSVGAFGTVYKGTITTYENDDNPILIDVAVKTIKAGMFVHKYPCICYLLDFHYIRSYVSVYMQAHVLMMYNVMGQAWNSSMDECKLLCY